MSDGFPSSISREEGIPPDIIAEITRHIMNPTNPKGNAMKPIELTKSATKLIIGAGTSKIINDLIENNVNANTTTEKVTVKVSSVALGGLVAEKASEYTDRQIDLIVDAVDKIKTAIAQKAN